MFENIPLQELDVETLFKEKNLENVVRIEKQLEVEIEHKRRDLRSMVGDRYKDILAASDAIKSMENISDNIVTNINYIMSTSQVLVNVINPALNQTEHLDTTKDISEERSLIIQLRLALFMNNQIWTALEEENNLQAAQCYVFAQHIHTGLDLTRSHFLNRLPILGLLKGNLSLLRTTIFQQTVLKLQSVNLTSEEAIFNLNAQILLENPTELELLKTFIKYRNVALETVMSTQYSNVRLLVSAITKCFISSILLFYECFMDENDKLGKIWFEEDENNISETMFGFPVSPLTKYLPEITKQFRPKINHVKSDKTTLKNLVSDWLNTSKEVLDKGLTKLLLLVSNVKGLQLIRDEYFKIEFPPNWTKICLELEFPDGFSIWKYFFEELVTVRAKNLITETIKKISIATKSSVLSILKKLKDNELDMRSYVWTESHLDFDKENGSHKGLTMKSLGMSNSIVRLCEELDRQYLVLLSDVTPYIHGYDSHNISNDLNIEDHLITNCKDSALSLLELLSKILEEGKSSVAKSVFCARFLQAVCDLCLNMEKCIKLNGNSQNWRAICNEYVKHSHLFWKHWIRDCAEKTTPYLKNLSNVSSRSIIKNLYRWDCIEIQEQGDDKVVKSQIRVPLKPSVPFTKLLLKLNNDLCQILPHTLPHAIHLEYLEQNGKAILTTYKSFMSEPPINQVQALQFLFDVRFLISLCIPRDNSNMVALSQEICEGLRSKIDPFDLDVFYTHLQTNVKKSIAQSQVIYGCLLPNRAQLSGFDLAPKSKGQEKLPSILATSTPSTTAWFPVLPIRGTGTKTVPSKF